MIRARSGPAGIGNSGWMVPLADLSLILFIVTSGAIAAHPGEPEDGASSEQTPPGAPALGVAGDVYLDGPGAPGLTAFLAGHSPALGEQLSITGLFAPGERPTIARRVEQLAAEASLAGVEPRVIIQPAPSSAVFVLFAHDGDPQLAHGLLETGQQSRP